MTPFRVRIEDLRFPPPVPAGMNFLKLGEMIYGQRTAARDLEPIEVMPEDSGYRIVDGRHRAVARMAAGLPDVLAVLSAGADDV